MDSSCKDDIQTRYKLIEGVNLPQRFDYWMDKEFKIKNQQFMIT